MRILHILSQIELTGAEVYALELAHEQLRQGHQVSIISDKLHKPFLGEFASWPIHGAKSLSRFKLILKLRQKIKKDKIDIVHAHSRAGLRIAHWACKNNKNTTLISTVHGRQHLSLSKKIIDIYGDINIAICENVYSHLQTDLKIPKHRLTLLRNPFKNLQILTPYKNSEFNQSKIKISILGRASGPKGQQIKAFLIHVFPELLERNSNLIIDIVCRPFSQLGPSAAEVLTTLQKRFPDRIFLREDVTNYEHYIESADYIIAAGRVAIEALRAGKSVFALGEAQWHGLVTPDNISSCLASNFGDISYPEKSTDLNFPEILHSIHQALLLEKKKTQTMDAFLVREFSIDVISAQIQRIYESALWQKKQTSWIPILMYHKVVDQPIESRHKIYIHIDQFEKHLVFFQRQGFTTLTFEDLSAFRTGKRSWDDFPKKPLIITFDDGYKNNLDLAVPLLLKYKMKACFFLLANVENKENFWDDDGLEPLFPLMNREERKKLVEAGFEVGSHGFNHQKITTMTPDQAWSELNNSKQALEIEFNKKVFVFAYTYGDTNLLAAKMAFQVGYEYAVNTDTGGLLLEQNPFQIFRVNIFPHDTESVLRKKTSNWYRRYYFLKRRK